jgi:serine protease
VKNAVSRRRKVPPPLAAGVALTFALFVIALVPLIGQSSEEVASVNRPEDLPALAEALRNGLPYIPGQLLVRFKPDATLAQQSSVLRLLRSDVGQQNARWIGDVLHLRRLEMSDAEQAAEMLARQPEVLYAHPNYIHRLQSVPNDTLYSNQWNFTAINMPQAWDINPSAAAGVIVAVIDSGTTLTQGNYTFRFFNGSTFASYIVPFAPAVDFEHSRIRFGPELTPWGGWRTSSGQQLLWDASGHGTHVAGTIAQQTNNGYGFAGVANGATLMPIKACWGEWDVLMAFGATNILFTNSPSGCHSAGVVEGIRYAADNGAKVINLSLGGTVPAAAYLDALRYAVQRGAFVAIAAGNEALDGNPTAYPAAYAAQIDGVVSVGATNRRQQRATYSNHGSYVELAAPGGECGPDTEEVHQVFPNEGDWVFGPPRFDRYVSKGLCGTSMASPHVAGVAALLYSQGITNPAAIEAALKRFARDLGPAGRDNEYGHGQIDARAALRGLGVAK